MSCIAGSSAYRRKIFVIAYAGRLTSLIEPELLCFSILGSFMLRFSLAALHFHDNTFACAELCCSVQARCHTSDSFHCLGSFFAYSFAYFCAAHHSICVDLHWSGVRVSFCSVEIPNLCFYSGFSSRVRGARYSKMKFPFRTLDFHQASFLRSRKR